MTRKANTRRRHATVSNGFTLLEVLAAIAIVAIMAAVAVPRFGDFRALAYDSRSQQDLRNLATAQELYRAEHETYAAQIEDLTSFAASDGVVVAIESADRTAFRASASHPSGRHRYFWNSAAKPALTKQAINR